MELMGFSDMEGKLRSAAAIESGEERVSILHHLCN
jgi:hypothetical protein